MSNTSLKAKSCEAGFSNRFNALLDHAGFPVRGRDLEVSKRFNRSKAGARKWLKEDVVPRNLRDIVLAVIPDLTGSHRAGPVMRWLLRGNQNSNPFNAPSLEGEINHLLLGAIYRSVHIAAKELGMDVEYLAQEQINHIYDTVLRTCVRYHNETPDVDLIKDLLRMVPHK